MISPSTPFWGIPCNVPRFWRLRVAKDFSRPKYYIGQTIIHVVGLQGRTSEFLVDVIGISWTGEQWQYQIELPDCHPFYDKFDQRVDWVESNVLKLP